MGTRSSGVLGLCYEWRGNAVVVLHNFSSQAQEARFQVKVPGGMHLVNLLVNDEAHANAKGVHRVELDAHGYRWYRVRDMAYALRMERDAGAGTTW